MSRELDLRAIAIILDQGRLEARKRGETNLELVLDRMAYAAIALRQDEAGWNITSRFEDLRTEYGF